MHFGHNTTEMKYWALQMAQRQLRPIIIVGVLAISAIIAYLGTADDFLILAAAVLAIIGGVVLLKIPELGYILLILTMLVTYDGPSHFNVTMLFVVVLFGLWLIDTVINQKPFGFTESRTYLPLFVLVSISILAFVVGQLPWIPFGTPAPIGAQVAGLSMFVLSAMTYFLVGRQVRSVRWLAWMVWIFVGIGAIYTLGNYIPAVAALTQRVFSGFALGAMFWTWLVALALGQAVFNRKLPILARLVLGGVAVAVLFHNTVIGQGWKSGWVPLFAVLAVFLVLWSWRWLIPMGIGSLIATGPILKDLIASDSYSFSTRVDAWLIMWKIIKINPMLGVGPANYHWYTPLFRIRGYAVMFNSHNQYVDIVAQIGFLGLAAYLWFFSAVTMLGIGLRKMVSPDGFEQAYVYGVLAGIAGTLLAGILGDWVIPFFYNITLGGFRASMLPWLFMGGLVVIYRFSEKQ